MDMHMCLLLVMMEDLKCTGQCTCVNGCLPVGTQGSNCDCACVILDVTCGVYVAHGCNQYVEQLTICI